MSPEPRPSSTADDRFHERARSLAAEAVDADLGPMDGAWLEEHLASCPDCNAIADEYGALHLELRSLQVPDPPRDLWARTAAALDQVDARASKKKRNRPSGSPVGHRSLFGTAIAVGFVVLVAGASLLAQSPIVGVVPGSTQGGEVALATGSPAPASRAPQAPLAIVDGTSYWIASDQGVYQIKGSSADCTQTSGSCTGTGDSGQTVGSVTSDTSVSAVLAPDAKQAAVWSDNKIAIVPLSTTPQTVSLDLLTPRPTQAATPTLPTVSPSPASSSPAAVSVGPSSIASPVPTAAPTASPTPTASASGGTVVTRPTAILDGYEIVGRGPEFSADGGLVAFSARPEDHSTGPDVFVWRSGQERAHAVTSRHDDLFGGWLGQKVLVGEIAAGASAGATVVTTSYLFDPANGEWQRIDRPMLVAGVDPTGRYLIYWSGSVEFDPVSGLWQPGQGDLYFEGWADLTLEPASLSSQPAASPGPTATASAAPSLAPGAPPSLSLSPSPSAATAPTAAAEAGSMPPPTQGSPEPGATAKIRAKTPEPTQSTLPQLLSVAGAPASVGRWAVRWDAAGQNVAVWAADSGSVDIGRLTVFSIDLASGLLSPTMAADEVLSTFGFNNSNLVYTSAMDGKTYMKPVPIIPPSSVSTPSPTTPGQPPASAGPAGVPALATDRPGS